MFEINPRENYTYETLLVMSKFANFFSMWDFFGIKYLLFIQDYSNDIRFVLYTAKLFAWAPSWRQRIQICAISSDEVLNL